MKLIKYPDEIEKLMKVYEPYVNHIHDGKIENVPEEVSEAFEKVKAWAWEQEQYQREKNQQDL